METFFREYKKAAIAFSGGTDSAYLLYAALQHGADVTAYFARSAFQPRFELDDAIRLAEHLHARLRVVDVDVLSVESIVRNPHDRCYHCKRCIMKAISAAAAEDGYFLLLDGTNASDDIAQRAGYRALQELHVLSPLRLCGLTKAEIRKRSAQAGLFTHNKPAYACLATRIPTGEPITAQKLAATETAEAFLFSLGFSDFRVRLFHGAAVLQLPAAQSDLLLRQREKILTTLKRSYSAVYFDLEARG